MNLHNFKSSGGNWLGAARSWLQWHKHNGDSVTWGSTDELKPAFTVKEIEDLAGDVAFAAIKEFQEKDAKGRIEKIAKQLEEAIEKQDGVTPRLCVDYLRRLADSFCHEDDK